MKYFLVLVLMLMTAPVLAEVYTIKNASIECISGKSTPQIKGTGRDDLSELQLTCIKYSDFKKYVNKYEVGKQNGEDTCLAFPKGKPNFTNVIDSDIDCNYEIILIEPKEPTF